MASEGGQGFNLSRENKRILKGENKKRLILKVATEVFAEKGFNEATISQIASKANIAEGSIYDYFKNKEDLLFSIPEERMENFLSGLQDHLRGIKGALNKLRKLLWYQLNFYEKNRDYTHIFLLDIRPNPRFNKSKAYQKVREYSKLILQLIEEGKKEKVIRKEIDPHIFRDIILGSAEHITFRASILNRFPTLSDAADHLYDQITHGVTERNRVIRLPLNKNW